MVQKKGEKMVSDDRDCGPAAAIIAMDELALGMYLGGESCEPSQVLESLQERAIEEGYGGRLYG